MSKEKWRKTIDSQELMEQMFGKSTWRGTPRISESEKLQFEAIRYSSWLNGGRAALLFADFVILVEGETERALFTALIDDGRIKSASRSNVYVLDCLGKYNIHRFIELLSSFGIKHGVIYDLDEMKGRNRQINAFINTRRDTEWTKAVQTFAKDLETYLGLPRVGRDGDKPLLALDAYYSRGFSLKKLEGLIRKLEVLIEAGLK